MPKHTLRNPRQALGIQRPRIPHRRIQKKTKIAQERFLANFIRFAKRVYPYSRAPPTAIIPCLLTKFRAIMAKKNVTSKNKKKDKVNKSEQLGEAGALHYLQRALVNLNRTFDKNCLHIFHHSRTHNMVYIYPNVNSPEFAIVIEAKGGDSKLGERWDATKTVRVEQGTSDYLKAVNQDMLNSGDPKKQTAAKAIEDCMGNNPPTLTYMGVQTRIDNNNNGPFFPELIFCTQL